MQAGNALMTLIVCLSPHPEHANETVSSLRFGSRCVDGWTPGHLLALEHVFAGVHSRQGSGKVLCKPPAPRRFRIQGNGHHERGEGQPACVLG